MFPTLLVLKLNAIGYQNGFIVDNSKRLEEEYHMLLKPGF